MMEFPVVAAFVGAILIVAQQIFMMITGTYRGKVSIGVGVGNDKELERKVRRHGNLAENAAIFLVVLGFAEMLSGGTMITTGLGIAFLISRISHAVAFSSLAGSHGQENAARIFVLCRMFGALGTGLSGIVLGLYLLILLAS
ncbi:MAG: MAPEG family protein [Sedimentitalea sp.]